MQTVLPILVFSCAAGLALGQNVSAPLTREPYVISAFDGQKHDAELDSLAVQESHKEGSSRQIKIAFLRLPSTSPTPGMPIVFLMGGPGIPGTLMTRVPTYYRLFEQLRAIADVIIPDQRGVGMSTPNLDCPDKSSFPPMLGSCVIRAAAERVAVCAAVFRQ